jgi:hypothetical protein
MNELTLAVDGSEWSASRYGSFTSGKHGTGSWVGSRDGFDAVAETKIATRN